MPITSCDKCGYTLTHTKDTNVLDNYSNFANSHYTCLCMLFHANVICCVKGYSNLLFHVPILAVYTGLPTHEYEQWTLGNELGITFLQRARSEQLMKRCTEIKLSAMNNFYDPYLSNSNVAYYADN